MNHVRISQDIGEKKKVCQRFGSLETVDVKTHFQKL